MVNVNTVGVLNVTSLIYPLMAARKSGHVVNISSIAVSLSSCHFIQTRIKFFKGKSAHTNHVVYSAGKYFIEGFSEGLRREGLLDGIKVSRVWLSKLNELNPQIT